VIRDRPLWIDPNLAFVKEHTWIVKVKGLNGTDGATHSRCAFPFHFLVNDIAKEKVWLDGLAENECKHRKQVCTYDHMQVDREDRSNFPKETSQFVSIHIAVPRGTNSLPQHSPMVIAYLLTVRNNHSAETYEYHLVSIIYFRITAFLHFLHLPEFWKLENVTFRRLGLFPLLVSELLHFLVR
jgi:hypothetical protein